MRLFIRDSQRRTDPTLKPVNAKRAIYVGLVLWLIALVTLLASQPAQPLWWISSCIVGLALGLAMLVYLRRR